MEIQKKNSFDYMKSKYKLIAYTICADNPSKLNREYFASLPKEDENETLENPYFSRNRLVGRILGRHLKNRWAFAYLRYNQTDEFIKKYTNPDVQIPKNDIIEVTLSLKDTDEIKTHQIEVTKDLEQSYWEIVNNYVKGIYRRKYKLAIIYHNNKEIGRYTQPENGSGMFHRQA